MSLRGRADDVYFQINTGEGVSVLVLRPRAGGPIGRVDLQNLGGRGGPHADPFTLHICAALAEKERALIADRTRQARLRKRIQGATLGKRTNLAESQAKGAAANRETADGSPRTSCRSCGRYRPPASPQRKPSPRR